MIFDFLCNLKASTYNFDETSNRNYADPNGICVYLVTGDCAIRYIYALVMHNLCCVRCMSI